MPLVGFSLEVIDWYKPYLSSRKFHVNVHDKYLYLYSCQLRRRVPQGSVLGPLLFLLYINDMPQAIDYDLFLYPNNTCLLFQAKDLERIKKNHYKLLQKMKLVCR